MAEFDIDTASSNHALLRFRIFQSERTTTLLRYLSEDIPDIEIPFAVDGKPVTVIGENCFFGHREIKHIIFPSSLQKIEHSAFALCSGIHELVIPDTVTEIFPHAFRDCTGLCGGRVVLSAALKRLQVGTFAFCYMNGVDLALPQNLKVIEAHAFYSAGHFTLHLPDGIEEIQTGAFAQSAVHVEGAVPYEKRWFLDWPGGEEIKDSNGAVGTVSDVTPVQGGCLILTADMPDGPKEYSYPAVGEPFFSFTNPTMQEHMQEDLFRNLDAKDLHRSWARGLLP